MRCRSGHRQSPAGCVSSEQSSIVQYLNSGPGKPTFSPPRPHERGVHGQPTLVHNVETLAHLALIARRGGHWFRGAGLPSAPGTMLVTVSGAVRRPGVYEIEMGTTAGEVIAQAGGPAARLQALLTGGYFGAWLPARRPAAGAADPRGAAGGGRIARGGHRRRLAGRCLPAGRDGPAWSGAWPRRRAPGSAARAGWPRGAGRRAGRPGLLRRPGGGHRRHREHCCRWSSGTEPAVTRTGSCNWCAACSPRSRRTRTGINGRGPVAACAVCPCCRCPATRKGTGTGDERHAADQPDRVHRPRDVRRVAPRGHRARPVGLPRPGLAGDPALAAGPRQAGRPACPRLALLVEERAGNTGDSLVVAAAQGTAGRGGDRPPAGAVRRQRHRHRLRGGFEDHPGRGGRPPGHVRRLVALGGTPYVPGRYLPPGIRPARCRPAR